MQILKYLLATLDEGTIFIPVTKTRQDIADFLMLAEPGTNFALYDEPVDVHNLIFNVYSSDPAKGSPYNTGAETFNTSAFWKEGTSITGDVFFDVSLTAFFVVKQALR